MKMIIFLLIILFQPIFGIVRGEDNLKGRRRELVKIIDQELVEVVRLNRQIGVKKPKLVLRMAELYLEKARIINEQENEDWLSLSPQKNNRYDQRQFFKRSRKYFKMAQKTCYYILDRFKNFSGRGDVYYILAYNAKEFQDSSKAMTFFEKALKYSKRGSYTYRKSQVALAEFYYNKKKYRKAIPLYEAALKRKEDKWWTKDAYNLAWCYFRDGRSSKAIKVMEQVHRLSGSRKFMNMRNTVERDLAYFYSEAGRTNEAIAFYNKIGKDVGENLLRVGNYLKNQGKFAAAEQSLSRSAKVSKSLKVRNEALIGLLSLYERHGKLKRHLRISEQLVKAYQKNELSPKQIQDLKYNVAKMASVLQKQVVTKAYRLNKRAQSIKANDATSYFKLQTILEGSGQYKSLFHAGETQYAIKKYDRAAPLYDRAYDGAVKAGDKKIAILCLDGLMASLGGKGVSKKTIDRYLIKAYSEYLKRSPRSKKSFKIYQRLFSQKYEKRDLEGAERTLMKFKFHFPKAIDKQEAMLARIIDYYKLKKNRSKISYWVSKINSGDFRVSKKVAKKLRLILLSMQFDNVERSSSRGDKVGALKGYLKIYKDPLSSNKARQNSAYNIAVLFHEMGKVQETYSWSIKALSMMPRKEVEKFDDSFLAISTELFNRRKFQKSAHIYELSYEKLCRSKSKIKPILFQNANVIYLSENNSEKSYELIQSAQKCGIGKSNAYLEARLDLLKLLAEQGRWESYANILKSLEREKKAWGKIIYPLSLLREAYEKRGLVKEAGELNSKMLRLFKMAKAQKVPIPLEGLDTISYSNIKEVKKLSRNLENIVLRFPEKTYNSLLKKKFSLIDRLTAKTLDLFKIGSGIGIVEGYRVLTDSYIKMGREILYFSPKGKGKEYVTSFKKSMKDIANSLLNKARDFSREARSEISKSKILSGQNYYFMSHATLPITPKFFPKTNGVLMDRAGGKR